MAKSRGDESKGGKMSLEQRIDNYLAWERNYLTPKQIRRAAHKAHVSTDQVRAQATKS
jgi:hypothetical protein